MFDQDRFAMGNIIHTGKYDPPALVQTQAGREWLIMRRFGPQGEFLEVSDTLNELVGDFPAQAPALQAKNSMLGLLVRTSIATAGNEDIFLLVRRNVGSLDLSGKFYPVDGFAKISGSPGARVLKASGRHAHRADGSDNPNPAAGEPAMSWHFDATEIAWQN